MKTKFANLHKPTWLIGAAMCCILFIYSCRLEPKDGVNHKKFDNYEIVTIDSREYIQWRTMNNYLSITHKGNCKYCAKGSLRQNITLSVTACSGLESNNLSN